MVELGKGGHAGCDVARRALDGRHVVVAVCDGVGNIVKQLGAEVVKLQEGGGVAHDALLLQPGGRQACGCGTKRGCGME